MSSVKINFKPSCSGSPTVPKFRSVIKRDGDIELVPDGVRYVDLEIQSYADSCDLNVIIARYLSGDFNAIPDPSKSVYSDLTDLPRTRQEVLQAVIDAEKAFSELPLEARQKYNNSWQQFYLAFEQEAAKPHQSDPVPGSDVKE